MAVIGAAALGLGAPAAAEEQPLDFTLGIVEAAGWAGDGTEVYTNLHNTSGQDMEGYSTDFTVPEGATITGITDVEFVDGTERPDEGCVLADPRRVECHTNSTLPSGADVNSWFQIELGDDATGVLGSATYTVTADQGGSETAEATITALEGGVALAVSLEPNSQVIAAPGAEFEQTVVIRHDGGPAMKGSTLDFHPAEGVTVTGVAGLDLVDGAERPDEGCAVVEAHVECHTNATLAPAATSEVTFHLRMPETAAARALGDASVRVAGDNGGEGSDAVPVYLDADPRVLEVTATPEVEGAPGEVVEIAAQARNRGAIGVAVRMVTLEVPEGATIVGVDGYDELADASTGLNDGCALITPRQVECVRTGPLLIPGGAEWWRFEVQLDDDAPAGELGTAALTFRGGDEFYEDETVVTVTGGSGDDEGEELPDTGTSSTTVALAAMGLLLAGAVVTRRARRA